MVHRLTQPGTRLQTRGQNDRVLLIKLEALFTVSADARWAERGVLGSALADATHTLAAGHLDGDHSPVCRATGDLDGLISDGYTVVIETQ